MTAREYCEKRKVCNFGSRYTSPPIGHPEWRKLGNGYIGVADGTRKNYVAPGHIFAVEMHDGKPEIYSYYRNDLTGLGSVKPYAMKTLIQILSKPIWTGRKITFDQMIQSVMRLFPDIANPTPYLFWAEFGFKYNNKTGEVVNVLDITGDDEKKEGAEDNGTT